MLRSTTEREAQQGKKCVLCLLKCARVDSNVSTTPSSTIFPISQTLIIEPSFLQALARSEECSLLSVSSVANCQ